MASQLYTLDQAGERLGGLSAKSVRRLIASGDLESCDISPTGSRRACTRVSDEAITKFIKARTREPKRLRTH